MARFQLDNAKLEALRDIADDVVEADYVPYACLFDPHTLLSKNGELLQIIKVTGFAYEALEHDDADLRQVIRRAVAESIPDDRYALWFTTIRRKKNLSHEEAYPDGFSQALHGAWCERNQWNRKYINELYVTVVREGETADITSAKAFMQGLIGSRDRKQRNAYLEQSALELNATVNTLLGRLQEFGARRLGSVKRDGIYYGEHLEFLEKLINLEERPMPLAEVGLSDYLTSGEITFAYNALEVRSAEGERRFGAVMTVKEYKEASLHRIDDILHLPCEFIVTQCFDFVNAKQAQQSYKDQHHFMRLSGEQELAKQSELLDRLQAAGEAHLSYGQQQTTIFMIGESLKEVERNLLRAREALTQVGIVCVREDIWFEDTYWAMLPGNFEFLARLNYINTRHIAGFANIQNFPAGNAAGCPWGAPVTLFYTAAGTPYFFNFHLDKVGHTMLVGPYGSGKSVLLNFLLSESRQYGNRLFYLDAHGHAGAFIQAIGGNYYDLAAADAPHHLSPFSLPDSPSNRDFLKLWLTTLIDPSGQSVDETTLQALAAAVAALYAQPEDQRNLAAIVGLLAPEHPQLAQAFAPWHSGAELAFLFDHVAEAVAPSNGVIGFNVSQFMQRTDLLVPMMSYLLHRITTTFDGTPAILVLDEAWKMLDNPLFSPRLKEWFNYITSQNGLVIMTTEQVEQAASYSFSSDLVALAATQVYLPDDEPSNAYAQAFGLSEDECDYLEAMSVEYRHFMLKRKAETIIAELNLGGMDEFLAVLSGNAPAVEAVEEEQAPQVSADLAMHYGEG